MSSVRIYAAIGTDAAFVDNQVCINLDAAAVSSNSTLAEMVSSPAAVNFSIRRIIKNIVSCQYDISSRRSRVIQRSRSISTISSDNRSVVIDKIACPQVYVSIQFTFQRSEIAQTFYSVSFFQHHQRFGIAPVSGINSAG